MVFTMPGISRLKAKGQVDCLRQFNMMGDERYFSIYRSAAGSGKTRTLAKAFLLLALRYRANYFRHILAVTFTNKATREMKDRILAYLRDFANGVPNELAPELKAELGIDDVLFRQQAQEVLSTLLHQYSQFSISTIDAFFQKVIRSFIIETGLSGDFHLEIDQDKVMGEVIEKLVEETGHHKALTQWVVEYARENLENDKAWDIRSGLKEFSKEIFKEDFKRIEKQVVQVTADRSFFESFRANLWKQKKAFIQSATVPARKALEAIRENQLAIGDFAYGKNAGLFGFLEQYASLKNLNAIEEPGARIVGLFTVAENFPSKKNPRSGEIIQLAQRVLLPSIQELLALYERDYPVALMAEMALNHLYVFGLVSDIARKLKDYKDETDTMLLSDAPSFLQGVIMENDTPFIYEKTGAFYRHFLIDEFQDTSGMQWENFYPLLSNNLDQGYQSMVVGDVKQAIYRWRGGDLALLQEGVKKRIGEARVQVFGLNRNFRSASSIVGFNNALFTSITNSLAVEMNEPLFKETYSDVRQEGFKNTAGFVRVQFLKSEKEGNKTISSWSEQALGLIPHYLEQLQEKGVGPGEIAILVRKNEEGKKVVAHLLDYKNSEKAKPGISYEVISNESLQLDGAMSVRLLLSLLKFLLNPYDLIARAEVMYAFDRLQGVEGPMKGTFQVTDQQVFLSRLPEAFGKQLGHLKKLPLFELTETLIEWFALGNNPGERAYLHSFQDVVLDFSTREWGGLSAFLEWWEENGHKKSIQVSGEVQAVQVLSIHKSKGLQFRYVIIPFCSWSMDHDHQRAPNLWVTTDHPLFKGMGHFPVKYSDKMKLTPLSGFYYEERKRVFLDNINLLYVALTRAEEGMVVLAPQPSKSEKQKKVGDLLYQALGSEESLVAHWEEGASVWKHGEIVVTTRDKKQKPPVQTMGTYPSFSWRKKISILRRSEGYFEGEDVFMEKRKQGLWLHSILSRMRYVDEAPGVLKSLWEEGSITEMETHGLARQLESMMGDPRLASWFSRKWTVRTEVPILQPGGKENRIDRLLTDGKQGIVIDFKTGRKKKGDHDQVLGYMALLRNMNFTEVEGYLYYVQDGDIVQVGVEKPRKLGKKDENQLGFFDGQP